MAVQIIDFDRPMLERFKAVREAAILDGKDTFTFDGVLFDVKYAKYVIEYLESRLAK